VSTAGLDNVVSREQFLTPTVSETLIINVVTLQTRPRYPYYYCCSHYYYY